MPLKEYLDQKLMDRGRISQKAVAQSDVKELTNDFRAAYTPARLVRIGGDGDGGYMMPDDFDGITHCFSPGVAE
ncbi:hypothetical protein [uncultured Roseovarius sp.]|uniref:hypothetical protein n=1 Tax=uncultured Roseovarius sp. TaxID=293344 RepID=UPI0025F938E4|nr:hypothetical protein [uncultured Roseovarius sp.]